ncbi:sensor histidine kinase [Bdellovibrionota bacterium]
MKQEVSCRVSSSIIRYLLREQRNLSLLMSGIDIPEEHLADTNSWISLDLIHLLFERMEQIFFEPDIAFKIGIASSQLGGWGGLDSVFRMIGEPKLIFHQAKKFGCYFYKDADLKVLQKEEYSIVVQFFGEKLSHNDLRYLQGALSGITQYWDLPSAELKRRTDNTFEINWEPKPGLFGQTEIKKAYSPKLIQDAIDELEKNRDLLEKKNYELQGKNHYLKESNRRLKDTLREKILNEKLASAGHMAISVAQELGSPIDQVLTNLGTINQFLTDTFTVLSWYEQLSEVSEESGSLERERLFEKISSLKKELEIGRVRGDASRVVSECSEKLRKIKKIVQELSEYANTDQDEMEYINVNEKLEQSFHRIKESIGNKAEVKFELGDVPLIRGFQHRIGQAFTNILSNAVDAIEEVGEISIKTSLGEEKLKIQISDNGQGIDERSLPHIFEPFFTTKQPVKGMGLGLSTAKGIISSHRGNIEVFSEVGKGTTFTIELPVQ